MLVTRPDDPRKEQQVPNIDACEHVEAEGGMLRGDVATPIFRPLFQAAQHLRSQASLS
jgi:hypothetical protein